MAIVGSSSSVVVDIGRNLNNILAWTWISRDTVQVLPAVWSTNSRPFRMDSKGRGRPPAKILTDHFTQIEKVGNQSNCWYYQCNYCGPDGKGARIENWDNKALKHLLVNQDCPNCPQSVRNMVCTHLALKSVDVFLAEPITASTEAKNESTSEASTGSSGGIKAVKHPRTLMGFTDTALTTVTCTKPVWCMDHEFLY